MTVHPTELPALEVKIGHAIRVEDNPPRTWSTNQVPVTTDPQRVASERDVRAALVLVNMDTAATVYIAPSSAAATATTGFPLLPGASVTLEAIREVWAVASTGAPTLALLAQFRDG